MNKTLKREVIIGRLNNSLKAPHLSKRDKLVIATFAENVLIGGGSYNGYTVETDENVAKLAGISTSMFKLLAIDVRKELEVSTRRYF